LKSFCISHKKDVDGLGAAAIVRAATGADFLLSDYDDLIDNLGRVPPDAEQFVLCDIGTDNADSAAFVEAMGRIARKAKATYVDHHFLTEGTKRKLRRAGVRVVHDVRECSSMLAYRTFAKGLPQEARLLALYGAVTDYMDDSPLASNMMEQVDRQFVLLEASMLSYALGNMAGEEDFPQTVVARLSEMEHPHDIPGVPEAAVRQLQEVARLEGVVKDKGVRLGRLAYMVTKEYSTGNVAKLLIGAFGVPVGVAMKEKQEGWYEVSLRSTSESRVHLGRAIAKISARLGGSGGGHRKAAGCRVPAGRSQEMLRLLARKV
jgi:DHHA1 domain